MKRTFCILAVLFLLPVFAGCAKKQEVTPPSPTAKGINCDFTVNYNGLSIDGHLDMPPGGDAKLSITSPAPLSGMTLTFSDGKLTLGYLGMQAQLDPAEYPETGFGGILLDVLEGVADSVGIKTEKQGDNTLFIGNIESGEYRLLVDKSLHPLKMSVAALGFEASFSNFGAAQ